MSTRLKFIILIIFPIVYGFISICRSFNWMVFSVFLTIIILFVSQKKIIGISAVICLVYSNFIAPMDSEVRFDGLYPSIHTYNFWGFKGVDVILVSLMLYAIFKNTFNIKYIKNILLTSKYQLIFTILGIISTLQIIWLNGYPIEWNSLLFILRGVMAFYVLTAVLNTLNKDDLEVLIKCAINTCLILMLFATFIPSENGLERELFGIPLKVAFAGDEYSSLGLLVAALLLLSRDYNFRYNVFVISIAFFLALLSGRKAAIPYFLFCYYLILFTKKENTTKRNIILLFEHIFALVGVSFIIWLNNPVLILSVHESIGILDSTLDSLAQISINNILYLINGIGPLTKYPLINIDFIYDHQYSFGADFGELYKTKLWFMPFGRLFLNYGLIGIIIAIYYLISSINKKNLAESYIYIYLLYFLTLEMVSIIYIFSIALAYISIITSKNKKLI